MGKTWNEGTATLWASWRQGLKELSPALVALPTSNIRPVEELGGFANPTQMEVNQDKGEIEGPPSTYEKWIASKSSEQEAKPMEDGHER